MNHLGYLVSDGSQFLAGSDTEDTWTYSRREALVFETAEGAENCADAWFVDVVPNLGFLVKSPSGRYVSDENYDSAESQKDAFRFVEYDDASAFADVIGPEGSRVVTLVPREDVDIFDEALSEAVVLGLVDVHPGANGNVYSIPAG